MSYYHKYLDIIAAASDSACATTIGIWAPPPMHHRLLPCIFITTLGAFPIETPSNGGRDFHPYRGGKNPYRGGEPWFRWRRHFSWQIETLSLTPARLRRLLRLWRLLKLNILSAKWWQWAELFGSSARGAPAWQHVEGLENVFIKLKWDPTKCWAEPRSI